MGPYGVTPRVRRRFRAAYTFNRTLSLRRVSLGFKTEKITIFPPRFPPRTAYPLGMDAVTNFPMK